MANFKSNFKPLIESPITQIQKWSLTLEGFLTLIWQFRLNLRNGEMDIMDYFIDRTEHYFLDFGFCVTSHVFITNKSFYFSENEQSVLREIWPHFLERVKQVHKIYEYFSVWKYLFLNGKVDFPLRFTWSAFDSIFYTLEGTLLSSA